MVATLTEMVPATTADVFPDNANETLWTPMATVLETTPDAFPNDATETSDLDGAGVGDNSDAFPDDANEDHRVRWGWCWRQ